jgi:hypothetical protein
MSAVLQDREIQSAQDGLFLTCRPGKFGNSLSFPYTLENRSRSILYPMHAMPSIAANGDASVQEGSAVVILGGAGDVILGKFAAPLPTDRQVAVPAVPLAKRLLPGDRLEGLVQIPMPLAETSPYFADLPLRQYEMIGFDAVVFTMGYWVDGIDGLAAAPVDYAPDLFVVVTRKTLRSVRHATQRFPTKGLQIFRRLDAFPRRVPENLRSI